MENPDTRVVMPSIGILFKESWKLFRQKFWTLVAIMLIPIVIIYLLTFVLPLSELESVVNAYISSFEDPSIEVNLSADIFLYFGLFMVAASILTILSAMAIIYTLGKNTEALESYAKSIKKFWPFIWMAILSSFIKIGGFFLAIIPGIIISLWFIFSAFILIEEDKRGMEALLWSKEYVRGYWWAIFGRVMALFLIIMLLSIGISIIVNPDTENGRSLLDVILQIFITPFSFVFLYTIYNHMKKAKPSLDATAVNNGRGFLVFTGILGLIIPIVLTAIFFAL